MGRKLPGRSTSGRAGVSTRPRRRQDAAVRQVDPPTRKGTRSREKLKAAALRALERNGYRNLRLTDIAREADVNISLVYHYFRDKSALVFEALCDVIDVRRVIDSDPNRPHEPFAALHYANKLFAEFYRKHPGLIRSLIHFDEEHPEFHELYAKVNREWSERIARTIQKRCPDAGLTDGEAMATAYAMGGMVEKFLFEYYVERNPDLRPVFRNSDEVARFLAILWYRAIYLSNPDQADLGPHARFARLALPA